MLIAVASALLVALAIDMSQLGRSAELATVDARIVQRGERPSPVISEVAILQIDDSTDARIGRWPYPRSKHADALRALADVGVRVVVLDIQFLDRSETPREDAALIDAIHDVEADGVEVVLASGTDDGVMPLPFSGIDRDAGDPPGTRFEATGATLGSADVRFDEDGTVRTVGGGRVPSLGRAALRATGHDTPRTGEVTRLTWSTVPEHGKLLALDYADAIEGRSAELQRLRGRTVFVGATSAVLHDDVPTPIDDSLPGVQLHALTWLDERAGTQLQTTPRWLALVVAVLLALGSASIMVGPLRGHVFTAMLLGLAAPVGWIALAVVLFHREDVLLPIAAPVLGAVVALVALVASMARRALHDRRHVARVFGRYLAPSVVRDLLARDLLDVAPGGVRREVTILFADVRGFTRLSSTIGPDELVAQLNEYFESMVAAIDAQAGTVDKFMGDGIMAFFGAPGVQPDHARRACAAARDMHERLVHVNAVRMLRGLEPLDVGIGIATGEVVVGNVGSSRRLEYTAIGDAVNLASRLEGATKELGVPVVMSAATAAAVAAADVVEVGAIEVRGVDAPVRVATLRGLGVSAGERTSDAA